MMARALGAVLLMLSLVGGGYGWGAHATSNRIGAELLAAERTRAIAVAINNAHVQAVGEQSANALVGFSTIYQKAITDENATQTALADRLRSGAVRLSVPTLLPASCPAIAPAAGAGGRDGAARAELSVEGAQFLTGLLSEADIVVHQLSACQADLLLDRSTVNQEAASEPAN